MAAQRRSRIPWMRWHRRRRLGRWLIGTALVMWIGWNWLMGAGASNLAQRTWTVIEVSSGGTLILQAENSPRTVIGLLGIVPIAGREADYLHEIQRRAQGAKIRLTIPADRAASSPPVGYVYLNDGLLLNEWLLATGLAATDGSYHPLSDWFARQERKAKWRPTKLPAAAGR